VPWVQVELGDDVLLGFAYSDPSAGRSAKGAIVRPESFHEDVRRAIERPDATVRLEPPGYRATPLGEAAIAQLGLPATPSWLSYYGEQPGGPWRTDSALAGQFHPDAPDDLQVEFHGASGGDIMWVRTTGVDVAVSGYIGTLLNSPKNVHGVKVNDVVTYRAALGAIHPIWVSPAVRANLEEWETSCASCGFDLLLGAASDVIARQFSNSHVGEMVSFTTRCPMCNGSMLVKRRS
jgi:hypothetical protein